MALFPALHNVISPLLTLWRLRTYTNSCPDFCPGYCVRSSNLVEPHPQPPPDKKPTDQSKGGSTSKPPDQAVLAKASQAIVDKMDVSSEVSTEEEERAVDRKKSAGPFVADDDDDGEDRVERTRGPGLLEGRARDSKTQLQYSPPRDNYGNNECRADPSLLNTTITLI